MKVSEEFNKYFRSEDIRTPLTLTISSTAVELLGENREKNLVVAFAEDGRRLVAKPMRRNQLVALFGDDTADWLGQRVELFTTDVWFGQKQVPSIQCRAPGQRHKAGNGKRGTRPPMSEDVAVAAQAPLDDDPELADDPIA
jgi:hypothetical protein